MKAVGLTQEVLQHRAAIVQITKTNRAVQSAVDAYRETGQTSLLFEARINDWREAILDFVAEDVEAVLGAVELALEAGVRDERQQAIKEASAMLEIPRARTSRQQWWKQTTR